MSGKKAWAFKLLLIHVVVVQIDNIKSWWCGQDADYNETFN
jgi:hypothetical protein